MIMVRFVYNYRFRFFYLIIGIISFIFVAYFFSLENIKNLWYVFLLYMSLSFLIHAGFSMLNNGFQNASVYMFGAFSWMIGLIFSFIGNIYLLSIVLVIMLVIQISLFKNQAPDEEKI